MMIDASCVRLHQRGATGKGGSRRSRHGTFARGGLTSKIHALVDAEGRPLDILLMSGQRHDGKAPPDLLEALEQDTIVLADKALAPKARRKAPAPKARRRGLG